MDQPVFGRPVGLYFTFEVKTVRTGLTGEAAGLHLSVLVGSWGAGLWARTPLWTEVSGRTRQGRSHGLTRGAPVSCE